MTTKGPRYPCMMHLTTRGTFYDVGYNVGYANSTLIKKFFAGCQKEMVDFYETPKGHDFYEKSLKVCQASYPQYVKELKGIADGSGVPFEHIFIANVYEYPLAEPEVVTKGDGDGVGCTALFLVDNKNHQYVLHNEDMWSETKEGYLLTAEIEEEGYEKESFTSFCYPGFLPNWAFGFNYNGLTFNINAIHPAKNLLHEAPGTKFMLRSLLQARDVAGVVKLAKNTPYGLGYGCVINICTKSGQMTSIEVAPGKPEAKLHVYDVIAEGAKAEGPCHYFHFNVYKHLQLDEKHDGAWNSSKHRLVRTQAVDPPCDLQAALNIMADNEDKAFPTFRIPSATDAMETVCTAMFDITGRRMGVFQGREDMLKNTPLLTVPLDK